MKKGISIIMITFNRKDELAKTLDKLSNMRCTHPLEIIVVDQNSTDGTSSLFQETSENVKYYHLEENLGVAGGRNFGARKANYEYMIFLDDDAHFVDDDALIKVYDILEKTDYDMYAFQVRTLDGDLYNWPYPSKKKDHVHERFDCNKYIGCGHAIKKTFFDHVEGYSDCLFFWGEETELVLKSFATNQKPVLYLGDIQVIHRVYNQGRIYDASRFRMQVRNRYYMLNNMFGISACWYKFYYHLGYRVKAYKNSWMKEYHDACQAEKEMIKTRKYVLSFSQLMKYLRVNG